MIGQHGRFVPIPDLTPGNVAVATKGRVTSKTNLRWYSTSGGLRAPMFSCGIEEGGACIRAVFFGPKVQAFYDQLQRGREYVLYGGLVQEGHPVFNYVANPYEIVFDGALVFAQDSVSYSAVDAVPALVVPQRVNLLGYLTNASPIANYGTGASTGQSLSFWNCPSFRGCLWEQERSAGKGKGLVLVVGE